MSDLVERLRKDADAYDIYDIHGDIRREAANEIDRSNTSEKEGWRYADELKQEIERLRAAFEEIVWIDGIARERVRQIKGIENVGEYRINIARKALNPDDCHRPICSKCGYTTATTKIDGESRHVSSCDQCGEILSIVTDRKALNTDEPMKVVSCTHEWRPIEGSSGWRICKVCGDKST